MFRREDTRQVANLAVQVLRQATVLNPDSVISYALCRCLAARFETTLAMNDFEEAMTILDRIVTTHSPGNRLTEAQTDATISSKSCTISPGVNSKLQASAWNNVD
ncbi:hypothetical protein V8E53_000405 [Lactarius tabidus]